MGRQTDNRISYIRKPMAEHGYLCLGLAGVGLLLCVAGMAFSVRSQGNTPVGALSMCFSSILFSVASLMYGWKSFKEEEKNYIFFNCDVSPLAKNLKLFYLSNKSFEKIIKLFRQKSKVKEVLLWQRKFIHSRSSQI